jgi:ATP-dependent helicase/nuclease subunit B
MLPSPLLIPAAASFWQQAACAIMEAHPRNLSAVQVVVPTFGHGQQLKRALAQLAGGACFMPPRTHTLPGWLALQPPDPAALAPDSQRLMTLYAVLRQQAWLKKLFSAKRNTDLLPLAQTLLALSDELTQTLLPSVEFSPDWAEQRWQEALAQLSPAARSLLSDEAQLVWTIWKSQLDTHDPGALRLAQMLRLAERASEPLVWIGAVEPDPMEQAFLNAYSRRQSVLPVLLDWRPTAVAPLYRQAWRELPEEQAEPASDMPEPAITPQPGLALCQAASLEDEARQGAQTVINWLQAGKSSVAIIAQDRVVARRIRALLERAQIFVADETGWKLSTTRAAAVLAAWFEVVATRAETIALLDLLKSPFFLADRAGKAGKVMLIENRLRRANVAGGWDAVQTALAEFPAAQKLLQQMGQQASQFAQPKTLTHWIGATRAIIDGFGMQQALAADAAGIQVLAMLDSLEHQGRDMEQTFSFAEWRVLLDLQFEELPFIAPVIDQRVVMLSLNGARLRAFDAVLMVGADAAHLPSPAAETLFFGNAVRRELGLATRESLQRQQLRDLAELLSVNPEVVLSWQAHKDGEPNPATPWIERLQLALERAGAATLPPHEIAIAPKTLRPLPPVKPLPSAPQLAPTTLSASGYNTLVACPYQFFVTRMLHLSALDELSDMPEKRDYGGWLHDILQTYHETVRDQSPAQRELLLREISAQVFDQMLQKNGAALGYYARWQKVIPAYLDWANAREQQGWRFVIGEQWFERRLQWDGGEILLQGRIDRIDENDAGERAVLDYKTRSQAALKAQLAEGEDQQLPFYGLLCGTPVVAAHFVAIEQTKEKTGDAPAPRYAEWQRALESQIEKNMQAIQNGAALPAHGVETVCQYCDVRGLCRKGSW